MQKNLKNNNSDLTHHDVIKAQSLMTTYAQAIEKLKAKRLLYQKQRKSLTPLVNLFEQLKRRIAHTKELLDKAEKHRGYIEQLEAYDHLIYEAHIRLKGYWTNHNTVIFKRISDTKNISYLPHGRLNNIVLKQQKKDDTVILMS